MLDLLNDLSTLTNIPKLNLDKLSNISEWCICHGVEETLLNKKNICDIDIGIGTLKIKVEDDGVYYKFIPSRKLEKSILSTVSSGQSLLTLNVEECLRDRITNVYKELF